ncbi:MAG: hypothetical protein JKY01_06990 [Pseudomonadales bacterium]|nr:hypothetical protein [Pseudomonadales bacterium]
MVVFRSLSQLSVFKIIVFCLVFFQIQVYAKSPSKPAQFASQTQIISKDVFEYTISNSKNIPELTNIKALKIAVDSTNLKFEAVSLVVKNLSIIKYYIDDVDALFFIGYLLDNNIYWAAKEIFDAVLVERDEGLSAQASYYMGRYFFERKGWEHAAEYLAKGNEYRSDYQASHVNLMLGVSRQQLKKHRESLSFYQKIKPDSDFFRYAQLNTAIALLKQGWWADSYRVIRKTVINSASKKGDEFINRAYLILGYGMLQSEYNKDASEAFKNIEEDSTYAQRAMLGLVFSSMGGDEFSYARNMLALIKRQEHKSLVVDEAYLLDAYVLEQMGMHDRALKEYQQALSYYELKSRLISSLLGSKQQYSSKIMMAITFNNTRLDLNDISFDLGALSESVVSVDYRFLLELEKWGDSKLLPLSINKRLSLLINQHQAAALNDAGLLLKSRQVSLQSYESQCRYAVARLLDEAHLQ